MKQRASEQILVDVENHIKDQLSVSCDHRKAVLNEFRKHSTKSACKLLGDYKLSGLKYRFYSTEFWNKVQIFYDRSSNWNSDFTLTEIGKSYKAEIILKFK